MIWVIMEGLRFKGRIKMRTIVTFALLAVASCCQLVANEKDEVQKRVNSYVDAVINRDPDVIAEHWVPDAQYTNPHTQVSVQGREAIKEQFKELFDEHGFNPTAILETTSIDFPEKDKAIQRGKVFLNLPGSPQQASNFQVNLTKQNNQWYISSIDEVEVVPSTPHYENLKDLEWLIGQWLDNDQEDNVEILSNYQWDKSKNFITNDFQVTVLGTKDLDGRQVIGWDPANNKIRSWLFDSEGGIAEANWKKVGNRWVIESIDTLPDGSVGSQTTIITPIDRNSFNLEMTGREVDGEILPNLGPVKIIRKEA